MKDNLFRCIYGIVCLVLLIISIYYRNTIISKYSFEFSYYASVATLIAIIITIMEIIYSIKITKSINEQSKKKLTTFKDNAALSLSHECVNYYNTTIDNILKNNYELISIHLRVAFKLHINIANNYMNDNDKEDFKRINKIMNKLEIKTARILDASMYPIMIDKKHKNELIDSIMEIKHTIEFNYTFKTPKD